MKINTTDMDLPINLNACVNEIHVVIVAFSNPCCRSSGVDLAE